MLDSKLKAPVFTVRTQGREYGEFVLEPLERGFGVTLGNPLRRILLSSIPGTAVTSVYIEDVLHEFSTIPGVKEDVVEIILNLKELVVRFLNPSLQTVTLLLKAEGPKEVKARDFLPVADVEIMNPDLHIATLEEGGRLNMEVRVDRGWGTSRRRSTASRTGSTPSRWTPSSPRCAAWPSRWRTPAWGSAPTWTSSPSGSGPTAPSPPEALNQAVEILREHLTYFSNPQAAAVAAPEEAKEPEAPPEQEEELDLPLEELGLSTRVLHSLKEEGIESVRALLALNLKDLKNIPGIGERSLEEIKEALEKKGFTLKE